MHHVSFTDNNSYRIWYTSSVIHVVNSTYWVKPPFGTSPALIGDTSHKQPKKKTGKFPQLNHNSWSLLWMIPSHKEPEWLFWMSDDFKISNCFYPPVANIWGILMFNLFVCCSTQSTWQQGCHYKISSLCMGEYNKTRQGIKQLGNSFWFYFFFHFLMKVGEGHIHSSCRGKSPAPTS